jgi:hypothetical protein
MMTTSSLFIDTVAGGRIISAQLYADTAVTTSGAAS